jgi:signal transduction histidine kinase
MEKRYVRKDGTIIWVFLTFALVRMASGEPDYLIKVVEDIGEAKKAAAERDELLHREREARENAERASKFAELFVAMLGHDLRNPLSAIRTGGTLLAQSVKEERAQRAISRILNSSYRMARMIDQLLDFTCIRAGKGLPYQPAPIELREVLFRVREELMSSDKTEKNLDVAIQGPTEGVWDGDRLAQVFSNLFANALEHSPVGALVHVNADGRASDHVEVTIHNPGVIPAELVPALFEPFRQGRRGKSRGLGLGLYITKEIVVMHGGTIDVLSSESTRGTQFRVVLPRLGKWTQGGS